MANAYEAGAAGMPFAVFRGYKGTDYPLHNSRIGKITCPFTGEEFAAIPSVRPDVAIIHAQRADRRGNVHISGIIGVQREAVLAAKRTIVTVEEIVDDLDTAKANSVVLPRFTISAVCEVPNGAHPSYAHGYYSGTTPSTSAGTVSPAIATAFRRGWANTLPTRPTGPRPGIA